MAGRGREQRGGADAGPLAGASAQPLGSAPPSSERTVVPGPRAGSACGCGPARGCATASGGGRFCAARRRAAAAERGKFPRCSLFLVLRLV